MFKFMSPNYRKFRFFLTISYAISSSCLFAQQEEEDTEIVLKEAMNEIQNDAAKEVLTRRLKKNTKQFGYVHSWVPFPGGEGQSLKDDGKTIQLTPEKGVLGVLFFTASWCVPCQELSPLIAQLEQKYKHRNTKVIQIYSHDTMEDAKTFAKKNNVLNPVFANFEILKLYHNPPIPSLYIADRHGWLLFRDQTLNKKSLEKIDRLINSMTIY